MKKALIIIDVQNYFVNNTTKELPHKISSFIDKNNFEFILFTQFVNQEDSNYIKQLAWRECFTSPEIDIHPQLAKYAANNNVFVKHSYSIFKSNKLVSFLKKNNIQTLYLCGIDTDSCVLASAFEAFDFGYDIKILMDLTQSHSGNEFHVAARKIIEKSIQKE